MVSRHREGPDRDDDRDRDWSPYAGREREGGPAFPARGLGGSSGIGGFAHDRPRLPERQHGRGRPPRAYQRSDERIRDDVYDRLLAQDWIDAADVQVAVTDAEITLSGTVPSRQEKRDVEELAEQVLGVREIYNQLRLAGQSQGAPGPAGVDQAGASQPASPGKARPSS
jgi:BON domain